MKIEADASQAVQHVENKTEANPPVAPEKRAAQQETGDVVELSVPLDHAAVERQEQIQAQRVAALKKQIQDGTYAVDSREVAEKILSRDSGI